jgi:hypothetical protein
VVLHAGRVWVAHVTDATLGQAILAAALVATLYTFDGLPRMFAGAVLLGLLVVPGPSGLSMAEGLITGIRDRLTGDRT